MARRSARSLLIGADRFVWSVRHSHENGCREVVRLRREGERAKVSELDGWELFDAVARRP
ncbi:hypothetical protein AB0M48_23105 [Lentzea sp. NPDC051208]|uniref:hypothetical protein n=1 Tax=Lentzea sp. NPDC051208 TaxID=3154642 RepID=UPI003420BCF7